MELKPITLILLAVAGFIAWKMFGSQVQPPASMTVNPNGGQSNVNTVAGAAGSALGGLLGGLFSSDAMYVPSQSSPKTN